MKTPLALAQNKFFIQFAGMAAVLLLTCGRATADTAMARTNSPTIWKLEAGPEYYYWQETFGGKKLLDETGPRYALELSGKVATPDDYLAAVRFKLYYGHVDYNGQTQLGAPVKSTTDYYGGLVDFGVGRRWTSAKGRTLDLMGRFGVENWERDLNGPGGYAEHWIPLYVKLGVETEPEKNGWTGALGVKAAVYTFQEVDLNKFGLGKISLNPGTRPSGYGELGYQINQHLSVTGYFDSYWFAQSPNDNNGIIVAFQPESWTYQAGVKVGWTF